MRRTLWLLVLLIGPTACGPDDTAAIIEPGPAGTAAMPIAGTATMPTAGAGSVPAAPVASEDPVVGTPPCVSANGLCLGGGPFPTLAAGYARYESEITSVEVGGDMTVCQFITEPAEEDMDIVDVTGAQREGGHHLTLFGVAADRMTHAVGEPFSCEPVDGHTDLGTWLGSGAVGAPEGAAMRLVAGQALMLNQHYINTTAEALTGHTYIDVNMVPAKDNPGQRLASIVAIVNANINVEPSQQFESVVDCEIPVDVDVVMASNHMHEAGLAARLSVVRASGTEELLIEDRSWALDSQLNPHMQTWPLDAPFHISPGDSARVWCQWFNDTDGALMFPREMCIGALFTILAPGETEAPGACQNGTWTDNSEAH